MQSALRARRAVAVCALAMLALPSHGIAQGAAGSGAPTAADAARADFDAGLLALRDDRFGDAVSLFERSYQQRRVAAVALNLGLALRGVGRFVEARARFQEFLELATPAAHARYDREVLEYLADVSRRLARLRVTLAPAGARLAVNGRAVTPDNDGTLRLDPGSYELAATLEGYVTQRWQTTLAAGEAQEHAFALSTNASLAAPSGLPVVAPTAVPAGVLAPVSERPAATGRSSAWVFGLVGGLAAAAVLGVVLGVALAPAPVPYGLAPERQFETLEVAR